MTGTHLVVQAGTGTGKSLAYLVPAALSGKKVVVATATKALQDQLRDKDLPLVESGLGLPAPLDYAVLKGRSNYVCRQRVAEVGSGGIQAELGDQTLGRADEPDWEAPEPGAGKAPEKRGGCRATRGHGRRGAPARGLVADGAHWRPGRPVIRAVGPGLEHVERRAAGVPGSLQLPLGRQLLRRGGTRPGRDGRHRRGEHASVRRAPGQWRRRVARTRRGRLRRGAPARGGHDRQPRRGAHTRALPHPGDSRPFAGRAEGHRPARLFGRRRRPARHAVGRPRRRTRAPRRTPGERGRHRPVGPVGPRR